MDREDLIICVAIWMPDKARVPLICDDFRVSSIASRNKLRLTSLLRPILEVLGGQHGPKNQISEAFISMFFLTSFLHRILMDFWRPQIKKTLIFLKKNNDICKINVFDKSTKNLDFESIFGGQNHEKSMKNRV